MFIYVITLQCNVLVYTLKVSGVCDDTASTQWLRFLTLCTKNRQLL